MRTFKARQGPFQERPYYTANDIERICLDELTAPLQALSDSHRAIY
jgi:hypothetical protein